MKKLFLPILAFLFFYNCCAQKALVISYIVTGCWGHQPGRFSVGSVHTSYYSPGYVTILDTPNTFQLAPPMLKFHSVFFKTSELVSMQFAQPATKIFFTLNGKEPTENDSYYTKPILIQKSFTTLKAKVFGNGFLPSETLAVTFIKDGLKVKSVQATAPNEKYPGKGPQTLFDNEGGMANSQSENFMGYQTDSVTISVSLKKKEKITSVLLDFLRDYGSWIFLPLSIRVYYFDEIKNEFRFLAEKEIAADSGQQGSITVFEKLNANNKVLSNKIKIVLKPLSSIPAWHPGKGQQGWMFIDEIKIY